jgi:hypothetical protein
MYDWLWMISSLFTAFFWRNRVKCPRYVLRKFWEADVSELLSSGENEQ